MAEPRNTAAAVGVAPQYTMVFDQSAHLDWDWIRTFPQYYWYAYDGNGVQAILDQAITNLQTFNTPSNAPYYYTICEMGFFQKYIQENPNQVAAIQKAGNNFQVLSGGITSPDCLVCSGEGFIRNYLVGHLWLSQALPFLQPKPQCWIPDDFGQGPELPALLTALGFASVGFSRMPGTSSTTPQRQMLNDGVDFVWQASDGSQVITHWMLGGGYGFGDQLNNGPQAINNFTNAYMPISNSAPKRYSAAATANMYIPIDDDFSMPVQGVLNDVQQWNDNRVQQGANNSNVATVDGTFDQFIGKLNSEIGALRVLAPYNGTPYWTGYYASRAELKIQHYDAVRALTAAEVFALLTSPPIPRSTTCFRRRSGTTWPPRGPTSRRARTTTMCAAPRQIRSTPASSFRCCRRRPRRHAACAAPPSTRSPAWCRAAASPETRRCWWRTRSVSRAAVLPRSPMWSCQMRSRSR